jgi:hypothetical protein
MTLGVDKTITSTVTDYNGKYYINGVQNPVLTFIKGFKYRFYNVNNGTHPILFSTTFNGRLNGGTEYTTGVTTETSPFYIEIEITKDTPSTLYYYCDHHLNMGNSISIINDVLNNVANNNIVYIDPTRIATTGSNSFTGSQNISGSINLTGSLNITGSISLNGVPVGTGKLDETTFNSYTSSNDLTNATQSIQLTSIESTTSSLNTFSSSIDTTIKNKLNVESVISGSIQVNITGTTGYSTFSSSINSISSSVATTTSDLSSSIGSLSSSVATTTVNLDNRIDSIETSTGSLNSFTSSINTTIKDKMNADGVLSGSITFDISVIPGFSGLTNTVSSSISSSVSELSGSLTVTVTNLSSSLTNTDENQNSRITHLETTSGSLNSFTSSINTTIKSKLNTEGVISGSLQVNLTDTTGYSIFSSSISTSIGYFSSSVATTTSGINTTISNLSSSVATTTNGLSSSVATTISGLSSSIATTDLNQNNRLGSIENKTGSYATTGSNIFQGSQTITGSLYISQDLIVAGSSSIQHISSSIVNIADNVITVNASNPSLRFGGLGVIDSGSSPQVSGSILFDSVENQWIFIHQNQANVTSSMLIMGPETYNNVGNETHLTNNKLPKSINDEHIGDSNITDTGTNVSINSNTEVTGTLKVTGNITNPNITAIESSTGSLNTFTSSVLTAVELTGSNLTIKGNLLVKGTTTNVNTTTLDVDNNLINLNGTGATSAGLRVKDTTGPNQVSGSLLWDATNDYWIAGQLGSEQRLVRETEFNNAVTRIGNVETSTGSLNSFTSSINTTIKSKLNTEGVISGSVQVNHNVTTNYDANQHVDHTAVSISPGNGLSGGGTIAATRTLTLDTGSTHFTNGVKSKLNTEVVHSGSYLGTATTANLTENASYLYYTDARVKTKLSAEGVISGSIQVTSIANSQLTNSTITIGSTSTSLGGTSTSLAGLTSVTSTAFTGSLQGLATSETLSTVTGRGASTSNAITINYSSGGLNLNRPATSNYVGLYYQTAGSSKWFIGLRENLTSNNYICYSETLAADVLTLNQTTGVATFGYNMTAANFSGTHSGTSSGTNTGDQTTITGNAGTATTLQTARNIQGVSFNGSTDITVVTAGTGVSVSGTAVSIGQSVATTATPTFGTTTINGNIVVTGSTYSAAAATVQGAGAYDWFYVGRGSSASALWMKDITGAGWALMGGSYSLAFKKDVGGTTWATALSLTATSSGDTSPNVSITNNLSIGGTVTSGTWNGSSISTTYTAAKVTSVNAGTGISVDTTTGAVTVSTSQNVSSTGSPTFARVTTPKIAFERNANAAHGISWYNISTYTSWCDYMANGGATSTGPSGNITASTGTYVTSWARRFFVEDASTYGWIFEKGAVAGQPSVVAELRSSDGLFSTAGAIYSAGSLVKTSANSSYSTTFSSVTSVTVTHSLGTKDVAVFVYDSSDNMFWPSSIVTTSTSVVTVTFASSRSGRVVVVR